MPKRAFISFDFDRDKTLKDFMVAQAKLPDSPFYDGRLVYERSGPGTKLEGRGRGAH